MSDVFGNNIVGFPTRRHNYFVLVQNISWKRKSIFEVLFDAPSPSRQSTTVCYKWQSHKVCFNLKFLKFPEGQKKREYLIIIKR